MNDILRILGRNIKYYRTKLGLTQEELAKVSGVNRSHLAGIESAHLNPAVKTIEKLAKGLDVSVSDLFSADIEDE